MRQKRDPGPGENGLIAIGEIVVGEQMLRVDPEADDIIELANSIERDGLLQPIGVELQEDGRYQLLWGARRLAAFKRLKKASISAHVYQARAAPVKAVALVENLQRRDLTLAEEVEAVRYLTQEDKLSVDQVSAALSKGRSWVLNRMMVPALPGWLRGPVLAGDLPLGHVEEIARIGVEGMQREVLQQCLAARWSRSALRNVVDQYVNNPFVAPAIEHGAAVASGEFPIAPLLLRCEACGADRQATEFRLVRVCGDGCGPEPTPNRADAPDPNRGSGHE